MQKCSRLIKPTNQKQNQPQFVNKRTDLLSSLHKIKLPIHSSQSFKTNQLQCISVVNSLISGTSTPENVLPEKELKPMNLSKQSSETEEYCKSYEIGLEEHLEKQKNTKGKFLSNHKIDGNLRARMLDWMVEVMYSYNFKNKTYFAGIEIMDRYFANSTSIIIPTQLHIIGVQSMFIATKMQQVYPLKMKTVYEKIVHKKLSISQLIEMQYKIVQVLEFEMLSISFYDLAMKKITVHLTKLQAYSLSIMKQIQDICSCIAKYMSYNYDLIIQYDKDILANTLANLVLEIDKLPQLNRPTSLQAQCKQLIIDTIITFKNKYKGLNNLSKFTEKNILENIQKFFV